MVNHFYFYGIDEDFGPFFLKFLHLLPLQCQALHQWARIRQTATDQGIAFEALDNDILSCADPQRLQPLCDGLSAESIDALARKWLARLPHPFTREDRAAGYRYEVSILEDRVLPDPGPGPTPQRPGLLRGSHPREPGLGPARSSAIDL
jgi:hypothetical protein